MCWPTPAGTLHGIFRQQLCISDRPATAAPENLSAEVDYVLALEAAELKEKEISSLRSELAEARTRYANAEKIIKAIREKFLPDYQMMTALFADIGAVSANGSVDKSRYEVWLAKFNGKNREMLEVIIERRRVSRAQLALLIGVPALKKGGSFNTYASNLTRVGLIKRENDEYVLQEVE